MKIGIRVFKRYAVEHSYSAAVQFFNDLPQDMTMSSDPEQILTSLSAINDIREDNGRCSNTCKVCSSRHSGVVYLEPKVSREVSIPSESTFHFPTL